jgi:hypothetical protein
MLLNDLNVDFREFSSGILGLSEFKQGLSLERVIFGLLGAATEDFHVHGPRWGLYWGKCLILQALIPKLFRKKIITCLLRWI